MAKAGLSMSLEGLTLGEERIVKAFHRGAAKIKKEHEQDKTLALARLRAAGIVTRKGKLSKRYGG